MARLNSTSLPSGAGGMRLCLGASRWVVLVGHWALKVPRPTGWRRFITGLLGNMDEACISRQRLPHLCPVLWAMPGGFLSVMPRAAPVNGLPWWEVYDLLERVEVERKESSFGVVAGRIVCVDYAPIY